MNKVILQGNVGRDPKLWVTQSGKEVATFFLATSTSLKDSDGEWQTYTDWHRISVFRDSTVRWMKDMLKKGDPVYVEGRLTYQQRTDKYGQSYLTPHVVVSGRDGRLEVLIKSRSREQDHHLKEPDSQESPLKEEEVLSLSKEDDLSPPSISLSGSPTSQQN